MLLRALGVPITLSLCLLTGCGSKEAVMMSARIESPALSVDGRALTTELTGSFDIVLALGDRASDPTTISLGTFGLDRAGDVLVNPLSIDTAPKFPIELGVGKEKRVAVTVGHSVMDPDAAAELCGPGLAFVGTLTDSLGAGPTSIKSDTFAPICP